ncbi:MAG: zinc carboxypeptidase [Flavobacteriaceae bacterium]|nr:zinc carboxypeptidase [Flavobacteriaceae bacterium]
MKHLKLILPAFLLTFSMLFSQDIKSPSEFLGYELGSRFTRHHKVVEYFQYVSKNLPNVVVEKYGETNEFRPLLVAYLSSQENMDNLEAIRKANLGQTGLLPSNSKGEKAIVWLSYNVHGNEASSTEASMKTLYKLVTEKAEWLKNTVVIMDPCINPDGRDRYVNWYNQVKSTPFNTSQMAKEHSEPWPGGRPNHYLFDLNRDWAWATQKETRARLKVYNKWMPHVHVDFHEQGINNPYYFAPAAEPFHEVITPWQRSFQTQIGKNHAKYFDKNSWLYFTKESFDLLYPSYGDTYPTYMGSIGMTYEQAGHGRAGLGIQTDEGFVLTLKDRLNHHTTTGLSTVEISSQNAQRLNEEFAKFFDNSGLKFKSFVVKNDNEDKINRLKALLDRHEISYEYASGSEAKGFVYQQNKEGKLKLTNEDLVLHTDQPKGKMLHVLFEPSAKLVDSLTYDITAWSIPYAHGLTALASTKKIGSNKGMQTIMEQNSIDKSAYAYISKWNSLDDAKFLGQLLQNGITPRFAEKPFSIAGKAFDRGALIVLRSDNGQENFDAKLIELANEHKRSVIPVKTGFVDSGVDFGSYSVKPINKQRIAVLSGNGVSSLSFGEIWHFFEKNLSYPITNVNTDYFSRIDLNAFDVIIFPSGGYSRVLSKSMLTKLNSWISAGGTVIAVGRANSSFVGKTGFAIKAKKSKKSVDANLTPYAKRERENVKNLITGSIFKTTVDATHPLAFGFNNTYYTLKLSNSHFNYLKSGYNVVRIDEDVKPVSGFAGSNTIDKLEQSLIFGEQSKGRGSVVYMVDNPIFRSFWENGKLFLANAVFFLNSDSIKK